MTLSGFLFAFLVMHKGEPIILPTVITDPNQLYAGLAQHNLLPLVSKLLAVGKNFAKWIICISLMFYY